VKATSLPGELEALAQIHESAEFTIFLLKDFHPYMKDTRVVRLLRDLANRLRGRAQTLILVSPQINLPVELEKDITVLEFPLPDQEDVSNQLDAVISAMADVPKVDV